MVINLDRQPSRLRRTMRELKRFKTLSGAPLTSITKRLPAIDARDGREVASTADIDPTYFLGDQLYVQPDERLEHFFSSDEPVNMTRQEVAVARSHIEAWKEVASGVEDYVLILEDDIWFRPGARSAIDRGWDAAKNRFLGNEELDLLYISYLDAGGTADRRDICRDLFRPKRGLWFLSGYVLSQRAARKLLLAMPVKGPVDMWMNRRFDEIHTLALSSPAILQRRDSGSDNSYSVMPYLARAGVVDANAIAPPPRVAAGPLLLWCSEATKESSAMALSMLGLRVRVFDFGDAIIDADASSNILTDFDALVNPQLEPGLLTKLARDTEFKLLTEEGALSILDPVSAAQANIVIFPEGKTYSARWEVLCDLLGLVQPAAPYPSGTPSDWRLFRDDRDYTSISKLNEGQVVQLSDNSAWARPQAVGWPKVLNFEPNMRIDSDVLLDLPLGHDTIEFCPVEETFPGNLAAFNCNCVTRKDNATALILRKSAGVKHLRPYNSGALASSDSHFHGYFEADIKAANGAGLVTGFFLHRADPRQEIDFEITGDDPTSVLLNVYFNPGDAGTSGAYGYRGSPCRIPLGFDASTGFHRYSIEWRPDTITWAVDGRIIHRRGSWDPTPVPHLPMKLHFNLWAPRSRELSGYLQLGDIPAQSKIKNIRISR